MVQLSMGHQPIVTKLIYRVSLQLLANFFLSLTLLKLFCLSSMDVFYAERFRYLYFVLFEYMS